MKTTILLYTILQISILSTSGQILYTDIIPDSTILLPPVHSSPTAQFDINQDGIPDFKLRSTYWYQYASPSCCDCYSNDFFGTDTLFQIAWRDTGVFNGPMCTNIALDSGATIDDRFWWQPHVHLNYECLAQFLQCYQPTSIKYYGIKLKLNGNYHFGWVRLNSNISHISIFDMAINLTSNQPIITGQMTTGVIELIENNKLEIFPTITTGKIQIENHSIKIESVALFNSVGQLERIFYINSNETFFLDISNLKAGVYILQSFEGNSKTKIVKL